MKTAFERFELKLHFPCPCLRHKVFAGVLKRLCSLIPTLGLIWRFVQFLPFSTNFFLPLEYIVLGVINRSRVQTMDTIFFGTQVQHSASGFCALTHTDLSVCASGFKTHEPFAKGTILCAPKNRLGSRIFVTYEI